MLGSGSNAATTPRYGIDSNGVLTAYYLDGDTVLEEKQGTTTTAQYLWGNGLVRCNNEYPLTDGRANVRLTTNASQSITSSSQPDSFGVNSVTSGTASAYGYGGAAGYREEGISPAGLSTSYAFQKVGARYYDQAFGAFLTRDTDLSQKPYAYCDGDPVNRVDPTGHDSHFTPDGLLTFAGTMYALAAAIAVGLLLAAAWPIEIATIVAYLAVSAIYTALFVGSVSAGAAIRRDHDGGQQDSPSLPKKGIGWQGDKETSVTTYQDYVNGLITLQFFASVAGK